MDTSKINDALQDLIVRLLDAEKGYKEIEKASANPALRKWMNRKASERHTFHKALESHVTLLGGDAEVKTSFLGDLHRMFIDIRINNTSLENEFDAIVDEIKRGSNTLIEDYKKVTKEIPMPENIFKILVSQRLTIENELREISQLQEEFSAVEA